MNRNGFLLVLLICAFSFAGNRFILRSELLTDYSGNTNFLTCYNYDAQGNRLQERVWEGVDSITSPISMCKYSYNAGGMLDQELLLGTLGDTLSLARYIYGNGLPVSVRVLRSDQTLRYLDSLLYDQNNRLVEMRRYNAAMGMTFYHRYSYAPSGRKTADSLYELQGPSTYVPTQAILFDYNTDGSVRTEASWRVSAAQWYLISTVKFGYSALLLASAATYEGNGAGTRMTDSLAYLYDSFGNRAQEERFDPDRVKLHRIVYSWFDTGTTRIARAAGPGLAAPKVSVSNHSIHFSRPYTGVAMIYSLNGKRIAKGSIERSVRYNLPESISQGGYILALASGNSVTSHKIIITR